MISYEGPIKGICEGIYDGPHATPPEADDGGIFLGIKNVTPEGRIDLSDIRFIAQNDLPRWNRRVTPVEDDIVFSYEATLHRYARVPAGFIGCLGRRMALVRLDRSRADPRFVHLYFLTPKWRSVVESNVISGATVDRIPIAKFPDFPVCLPSIERQERIADVIVAYDNLIENNRRRIKLLEEAARLIYREWFVRLRFPGHEHTKIEGGVPEGWRECAYAELFELFADGDWIESKDQGGTDYRLLQVSNIGVNDFVETGNLRFISEDTFRRLSCTEILPGDILISRMPDPIGRAWMCRGMPWKMVTAVDVTIGRVGRSKASAEYVLFLTNSDQFIAQCAVHATGATRARVSRRVLGGLKILVPTALVQKQFEAVIEPIQEMKNRLRDVNTRLASARDLLLPRLMSGQIEV